MYLYARHISWKNDSVSHWRHLASRIWICRIVEGLLLQGDDFVAWATRKLDSRPSSKILVDFLSFPFLLIHFHIRINVLTVEERRRFCRRQQCRVYCLLNLTSNIKSSTAVGNDKWAPFCSLYANVLSCHSSKPCVMADKWYCNCYNS